MKEEKNRKSDLEFNATQDEATKPTDSHKYQTLGMSVGMCMGPCMGMSIGMLLFDNLSLGMCLGLSIGMCIGMALGAAKDKRISENILIVKDIIEEEFGCEGRPEGKAAMVTIVVEDKEGKEQHIRMADKLAYERKIEVGDRAFLEEDGTLDLVDEKEGENKNGRNR